jgi:hypothetical protein
MVGSKKLTVIWDKAAKSQLKKAYNKIKKESLQGAETVKNGILENVGEISGHPKDILLINLKKTTPEITGLLNYTIIG